MADSRYEYHSRTCEFCPTAVADDNALSLAQLGVIDQLVLPEKPNTKNHFKYGWMAGGSSHKLEMFKEILTLYPGLLNVEYLYPMGRLSRHGLPIDKPVEDDNEKTGTKIAKAKLNGYWYPFANFSKTLSCRRYGPAGSTVDGCQPDHFMFATDVNVWANTTGVSRGEGVCLRNPDEVFKDWPQFKVKQKRNAIIEYMTGQYRQISGNDLVTNTVESAIVLRRPLDPDWTIPFDVEGSSKMCVTMPLKLLKNERFVNAYINHIVDSSIGKSRSQTTENGVLNNIGGAAGGIMMEKMIEYMRIVGYEVYVDLPPIPRGFIYESEGLTEWDIIRGHAMGVPHILACELISNFTKPSNRSAKNPVTLYSASPFVPTQVDVADISGRVWKSA